MTRAGLVLCGAVVIAVGLQIEEAKSVCDDRQCRVSGQSESATETASQSVSGARAKRYTRRSREASTKTYDRRQAPRLSRREPIGRSATRPLRRASEPVSAAIRTSANSRRRFRAFIDPAPMAETQQETWRMPRMQSTDLTAPPSTFAVRIAQHSGPSETMAATDSAADSAHASSLAAAARRNASAHEAAAAAPSEVRSAAAPAESSFLRGLALALGGAATLASVLRLLIGA